jgi:hypothetical protein
LYFKAKKIRFIEAEFIIKGQNRKKQEIQGMKKNVGGLEEK